MPEVLTKRPDLVLKTLQEAGAKCGVNEPSILKHCPKSQLCTTEHGEICVYGMDQITSMMQISPADIAEITGGIPTIFSGWNIILLAIACLFGMFFGMMLRRR